MWEQKLKYIPTKPIEINRMQESRLQRQHANLIICECRSTCERETADF